MAKRIRVPRRGTELYSSLKHQVISSAKKSFGPNGNLAGMKQNFGWADAHPVKIGAYVYDVPYRLYDKLNYIRCGRRN